MDGQGNPSDSPPKQRRLILLLWVASERLEVSSYYWRHHTLGPEVSGESSQVLFCNLLLHLAPIVLESVPNLPREEAMNSSSL